MRTYAPLTADHPMITDGDRCAVCHAAFVAGDVTTLIPVQTPERGRVMSAVALPAHWRCVEPLLVKE